MYVAAIVAHTMCTAFDGQAVRPMLGLGSSRIILRGIKQIYTYYYTNNFTVLLVLHTPYDRDSSIERFGITALITLLLLLNCLIVARFVRQKVSRSYFRPRGTQGMVILIIDNKLYATYSVCTLAQYHVVHLSLTSS